MSRILELGNGDNFSLQYSNSIPPTIIEMTTGRDIYAKLTELFIPITFNKPIILINITTTVPIGKIWRYAGRCRQILPTALGDAIAFNKSLFLGKRNILFFADNAVDYQISYLAPSWFIDLGITVYQYDGIDTTDLDNKLSSIELKIDAL
ncbi:hypothetical protein [Calothrix sp. NIES-2098]|uniref:hypothetical protein n=1 Tax=Calothrix sp. NIES-2098 TaxID=1954171 RepID=UPI000B5FEC57|nr:hypothetical protein NIES2098_38070 [Calothrix sp. NIES-2098]